MNYETIGNGKHSTLFLKVMWGARSPLSWLNSFFLRYPTLRKLEICLQKFAGQLAYMGLFSFTAIAAKTMDAMILEILSEQTALPHDIFLAAIAAKENSPT